MKKTDLSLQFIFYIAITLVCVIGLMNYWFYHDHTAHLTEALENRASAKLDFLGSSVGYYLGHFEHELIRELGREAIITDRDVVFLSIQNAVGEVLFMEGSPKQEYSRMFSRQIIRNGEVTGVISLSLDVRQLIADRRSTMFYTAGLMILSVSLIGGMIYLFYRKKILYEIRKVHREKELLREEYDFFYAIINTTSNLVVVLDRYGYIMLVNQTCANTLGRSPDALIERHVASVMEIDCDGQGLKSTSSADGVAGFELLSEKLSQSNSRSLLQKGDSEIHVEWKFSRLVGENGEVKFLIGSGVDITRQHHRQLELSHLAHHDHLTSLPNRTLFNDRLQESFKQARRLSTSFALLFIDLDHFKPVNDGYGHEAGDLVLKVISQRMQSALREMDTVARLGGDEFGVLLYDIEKSDVHCLADKLLRVISGPIPYGDEMLSISASIGIAFYSEKAKDAKELINQADEAMYYAKAAGRNNYRCYDEPRTLASITDLRTENR